MALGKQGGRERGGASLHPGHSPPKHTHAGAPSFPIDLHGGNLLERDERRRARQLGGAALARHVAAVAVGAAVDAVGAALGAAEGAAAVLCGRGSAGAAAAAAEDALPVRRWQHVLSSWHVMPSSHLTLASSSAGDSVAISAASTAYTACSEPSTLTMHRRESTEHVDERGQQCSLSAQHTPPSNGQHPTEPSFFSHAVSAVWLSVSVGCVVFCGVFSVVCELGH